LLQDRERRRLLVALPALNEEKTIGGVIRSVPSQLVGIDDVEILVVDDGCSDGTVRAAREAGARVIHHPVVLGVGAAFQTALAYGIESAADLIVTIDADGQFDPKDIPKLIAPVLDGSADFSTASRFIDPSLTPKMPLLKYWGNRMMSRLISSLAGQRLFDVSCGMRCYSRDAALRLNTIAQFTYTQEVILNLAFKHLRVVEVPICVRGVRPFGHSRVARNPLAYGLKAAQIILRCYRDYHPLRLFLGAAALVLLPALALGIFLLSHYIQSGSLTPHKWAGFVAIGLSGLSALLLHAGFVGDMLNRHRIYLEELLYRQRRDGTLQAPAQRPDA
jgi:glycosyltransferase involved in cell wall biosynthesis